MKRSSSLVITLEVLVEIIINVLILLDLALLVGGSSAFSLGFGLGLGLGLLFSGAEVSNPPLWPVIYWMMVVVSGGDSANIPWPCSWS